MLVPTVLLPGPGGDRAYDLFSRLLSDRIVFLGSAITGAGGTIEVLAKPWGDRRPPAIERALAAALAVARAVDEAAS